MRAGYFIIFACCLGWSSRLSTEGSRRLVGGEIGKSSEAFFFVWTVLTLGVTAARALWSGGQRLQCRRLLALHTT